MPVFLLVIGILLSVAGLFLIGFFIPNRDFSVGSTFILSGTMSVVGGLLLIGIAGAVRELRKLATLIDKLPVSSAPPAAARPATAPPPLSPRPAVPVPPPRSPAPTPARAAVVNTARNLRAEPRLETP